MNEFLTRQQEIIDNAKAEERNLNEDEIKEFDALSKKQDEMTSEETNETKEKELKEVIANEKKRISDVIAICKSFNVEPTEYIEKSLSEVKEIMLEKMMKENEPVKTNSADVVATKAEEDKFRNAVADAIVYRGIGKGEANEFVGKSLINILDDCLEKDGEDFNKLRSMTVEEKMGLNERTFLNPTATFPSIVDTAVKKAIVEPYKEKVTTFQEWVTEGSVNDFKLTPDHEYVMGSGKFEKVPEGGELKQSTLPTELLPQRKIETYGTQFTVTREAFYNDDIGYIAKMPYKYTIGALRQIDKQVYSLLHNNGAIYDGKALFHADHKNLISAGSAPSEQSLSDLRLLMKKQVDQFGDPIDLNIQYILCPPEYTLTLYKLFNSQLVPGTNNNDVNPFYNRGYNVVETNWISSMAGTGAKPWYIVSDKNFAKSIQVDYLRGQKTPTFERKEASGRLGLIWDIFMDWGVAVVDYRGIYKNVGA